MSYNKSSRILVLGSGGRLGNLLRAAFDLLAFDDAMVFYQTRLPSTRDDTIQWAPGDGPGVLPACDAVIALWGRTSGSPEILQQNSTLAEETERVGATTRAQRMFHLSSAAIYGPAVDAAENAFPAPTTPYGASKLAMEARVAEMPGHERRHVCLRLANVVGADSLAPALTRDGEVRLDQFPNGDGPTRSYIGAKDLAVVILALTRCAPDRLPSVLNVAAPEPVSMSALARAAGKKIVWQPAPPQAVARVTLNTDRLRTLLPHVSVTSDPAVLIEDWRTQVRATQR